MKQDPKRLKRTWRDKFGDAFCGLYAATRGQSSFRVHFAAAVTVILVAALLRVTLTEWALLAICIFGVLAAEIMNTALEYLAKAIDREQNAHIGAALDSGSAAVLTASFGAAIVGTIVFGHRLWLWFSGAL